MKHFLAIALLLAGSVSAGAEGLVREEIRRAPVPGSDVMEVVVSKATLPPGEMVALHTHPGDEFAVVIVGGSVKTQAGQVVEFVPGQTLHFPAEQVHGGLENVGAADLVLVTHHVVDKSRPFASPAN